MSTSILYHGIGIHEYRYVTSKYQQGAICFVVAKEDHALRCPRCHVRIVNRRGEIVRIFIALRIGRKQIYIRLKIPRVSCRECQTARKINLGFADPR